MFNTKKIKKLEEKVESLESFISNLPDYVTDEKSGYLIDKDSADKITCFQEHLSWRIFQEANDWKGTAVYFKKGTAPKCDYIKKYLDGKIEYMRNEVLCTEKGEPIKK